MTANLNIKRGDLHLTVAGAMNRGRYVLMTDGKGQPVEITVDLRERDDDGFGSEAESLAATDDHGAAIPAQTQNRFRPGPVVYEFALQDVDPNRVPWPPTLNWAVLRDAPDQAAASTADWVHVYDRVTRERRTLKRPAPDAILTGLRKIASDLRAR
jgi:hypothetical protein